MRPGNSAARKRPPPRRSRAGTLRSRPGFQARSRCPAPARIPQDRPGPSPRPRNWDRRQGRRFGALYTLCRERQSFLSDLGFSGVSDRPRRQPRATCILRACGGAGRPLRRRAALLARSRALVAAATLPRAGRRRALDRPRVPGEVRPAHARPRLRMSASRTTTAPAGSSPRSARSSPACCPGPGSTSPRTTWPTSRGRACASRGAPRAPSRPPTWPAGRARPRARRPVSAPGSVARGAAAPCATCRRSCSCRRTAARATTPRSSGR